MQSLGILSCLPEHLLQQRGRENTMGEFNQLIHGLANIAPQPDSKIEPPIEQQIVG